MEGFMLRSRIALPFGALSTTLLALAACSAGVDDTPPGVDPTPENGIDPPFAVSQYFAPSGFMGDGDDGVSLVAEASTGDCLDRRVADADGDCYRFTYTAATRLWAGVYWQYPANNWGELEGKKVAPGATEVSFWAAGGAGGEKLKVVIGGIKDVTLAHSDTLKAEGNFELTTEMTRYTVPIAGQSYDKVIGGFSWIANYPENTDPSTAAPIVVYLDDIVWE
jgi:hypothetical protein